MIFTNSIGFCRVCFPINYFKVGKDENGNDEDQGYHWVACTVYPKDKQVNVTKMMMIIAKE